MSIDETGAGISAEEPSGYVPRSVEFIEGDEVPPVLFLDSSAARQAGEAGTYLPDDTEELPSIQEIAQLSRQEMWNRWSKRALIPAAAVGLAVGTYFVAREIRKRHIGGDELFFARSDAHTPDTVAMGLRRERGIAASFPKNLRAARRLLKDPRSQAQVFVLFPNDSELKAYPLDGSDEAAHTYLDAAKYFAGKIAQHIDEDGENL
jgi:hypothetical protein